MRPRWPFKTNTAVGEEYPKGERQAVDHARGHGGELVFGITSHAPTAHRRAEAFTYLDLGLLLQQEIEVRVVVVSGDPANTPLNGAHCAFTQPEG
jgi:hypothetical protein